MKKSDKGIQYRLEKEKDLWMVYMGFVVFSPSYYWAIERYIEEKSFAPGTYIVVVFSLALILYLLYAKYSKIKRKILSRIGVRHDAEIVRAKYNIGSGRFAGRSFYYLEIDFINSKGKQKTLYTPAYEGNPNDYLESAKCSVYEWKGFYVEADFQMRDEREYFGYGPIPTERKRFIWR